jgi:hypothetical protein
MMLLFAVSLSQFFERYLTRDAEIEEFTLAIPLSDGTSIDGYARKTAKEVIVWRERLLRSTYHLNRKEFCNTCASAWEWPKVRLCAPLFWSMRRVLVL